MPDRAARAASCRHLEPGVATLVRPVHLHDREERLSPGQCVPVDIEIWPFSVRFAAGETLRLVVAGKEIYEPEEGAQLPFALHRDSRNAGTHVIRIGGDHDSFLLLPFVAPL